MAAIDIASSRVRLWRRWLRLAVSLGARRACSARVAGLVGGALAGAAAHAAPNLAEDRADVMYHSYSAGGLKANGPALLVRKKFSEELAVSGSYYVDMVSSASIDVVTNASPYKEKREEYGFGVEHVVRNAVITLGVSQSKEPDYIASGTSLDIAQEVFGGMTTINLGFSRAHDKVGGYEGFFDTATHWKYRLGVTQILSPSWIASANLEAVSDEGFLGSPYRVARVFGAAVAERNPRTRSSRAAKFRVAGAIGAGSAVRAEYRYFWDNWDVKAHTMELGYSRHFGERWLGDAFVRLYSQTGALFYSDNATTETTYITRNRQFSTFKSQGYGAKAAYTLKRVPGSYEVKLNGAYELVRYNFSDYTDIRTGALYKLNAHVIQLFVSATF